MSGSDTLECALGWDREHSRLPHSAEGIEEALGWGASLSGSFLVPCASVFSSQQSQLLPRPSECGPAGKHTQLPPLATRSQAPAVISVGWEWWGGVMLWVKLTLN